MSDSKGLAARYLKSLRYPRQEKIWIRYGGNALKIIRQLNVEKHKR